MSPIVFPIFVVEEERHCMQRFVMLNLPLLSSLQLPIIASTPVMRGEERDGEPLPLCLLAS
jgi:hypothetical protein